MSAVTHYVEVNVPVAQAYAWWRGLTNLPSIMPDLESVVPTGPGTETTLWKVRGPLGTHVEWEARIVEDVPNQRLAWASIDSGATQVENAGAVRFDDHGQTTGVEVSLQFDPPGGAAGEAVAKLFADPQQKVEKALAAFKATIEAASLADTDAATTVKTA
jgi:uncharacterized membrane protein